MKAIAQDAEGRFIVQTAGGDPRTDGANAYGRLVILETSTVSPEQLIASIVVQTEPTDWRDVTDETGARQAEELVKQQA